MTKTVEVNFNTSLFFKLILLLVVLALPACVVTLEKKSEDATEAKTKTTTETEAKVETETVAKTEAEADKVASTETKLQNVAEEKTEPASQPEVTPFVQEATGQPTKLAKVEEKPVQPIRIVETCKNEPYVKYEKQSQTSINKGLAATKAGKFGVGFRDSGQYNRWQGIHRDLFAVVNKSCDDLKKCAAKHAKNKDKECAVQAYVYNEWKQKAESFAKKAKAVETTEPDPICSVKPNLADDPDCFHGMGDNFDKFCADPECKEVSDCWRSVGFLDQAIKQAAQACGFVGQNLNSCRGYMEATKRRKDKFDRCMSMQEKVGLPVLPAI